MTMLDLERNTTLRRLYQNDAVLRHAVEMAHHGQCTFDEALVLALAIHYERAEDLLAFKVANAAMAPGPLLITSGPP